MPATDGGSGERLDGGFFAPFTAPSTSSVSNSVLITITGEASATDGTRFPPAPGGGAPYFVDGWEIQYEHVLVAIGSVSLAENPEMNPNDPSVTGPVVAKLDGPWAVDLAVPGTLAAKEQNGRAIALARIAKQTSKSGTPAFEPTDRYALGFSLIAATEGAQLVNLNEAAQAQFVTMSQRGWSVFLQGTATWKGAQSTPACRSTSAGYDFGRFPKAVHFALGFAAPVNFKNCVNPELSPADSRGVQTSTNAQTTAQLTFHLDHPFWESLSEDAPLRWDAIAARKSVASGAGPASVELDVSELAFDFQAPRDAQGASIPWRTCGPVETNERSAGSVSYDPVNVPASPLGGAAGLKDFVDYMTYNLSTFGHLNNDGLCFPDRQFPSPR